MLNWWFVGRQAVIDVVLGPWTSILSSRRKSLVWRLVWPDFKFRVIPLRYLDFDQLVQIFYFILDKKF